MIAKVIKGKIVEQRIEGRIYLGIEPCGQAEEEAKITFDLETRNGIFAPFLGKTVKVTIEEIKEKRN